MADATTSTDIRLREGASIAQRLVMSAFAAAVALCFTPGLFTHDTLEIVISVVALLVGAGFVVGIMMAPAVVWIITPDEILIGHQRPFGKLQTRIVPKDDITGLQVPGSKRVKARFQLVFTLVSGERLTSRMCATPWHGSPRNSTFPTSRSRSIRSMPAIPRCISASRSRRFPHGT
jgi:hypothetical protein